MEAVGLRLAVGAACTVPLPSGGKIEAEVVGFEGDKLFLMPQSDVEGVVPGTRVFPVEPAIPRPAPSTIRAAAPATARATCRSARNCWAACSTAPAARWTTWAR